MIKLRKLLEVQKNHIRTTRTSKNPHWIKKSKFLNELIQELPFPVDAHVDPSYVDMFIYVNPKNRKELDYFMELKDYTVEKEGWYSYNPEKNKKYNWLSETSYAIKVKNKLSIPETF